MHFASKNTIGLKLNKQNTFLHRHEYKKRQQKIEIGHINVILASIVCHKLHVHIIFCIQNNVEI